MYAVESSVTMPSTSLVLSAAICPFHAPMGAWKGQIAALKTREVDGIVTELSTAYMLEKAGEMKVLYSFGDLVHDFHIHVVFATNKVIAERPQAIRAFLAAWFETIAFMRKNKAATVAIARTVMEADEDVAGRVYDALMPMFSDTGRFEPRALAVLRKSYVELKILDKEPEMSTLYTEAFLPK